MDKEASGIVFRRSARRGSASRLTAAFLLSAFVVVLALALDEHSRGAPMPTTAQLVDLSIVPGAQSIAPGDRLRLMLVGRFSDGSVRSYSARATWKASGSGVLAARGGGVFVGARRGVATVRASVDGRSAATRVRVGSRSLGPLRVSPANSRYFIDASGRTLYLAGAHTWSDLIDNGTSDPPPRFDYPRFLDQLQVHGLRLVRLFAWEQVWRTTEIKGNYYLSPSVYLRTGPGLALDGKPRFDLRRFNDAYFRRLRARAVAARERGIYVIVMLFNGWSVEHKSDAGTFPWAGHPFNRSNNVNGLDADRNGDGNGEESHRLVDAGVTDFQERYVRRVLTAVGDQPNVLFEISNESSAGSIPWQKHFMAYIRSSDASRPRHPVGISVEYPGGTNDVLLATAADWIAPKGDIEDPDPATGRKVVVADTDHLCGVCGDRTFPWRALTRGLNPLLMDPYDGEAIGLGAMDADYRDERWEAIRRRLGVTVAVADELDLRRLVPRGDLSSSGYCLADAANHKSYLLYAPAGGTFTVDLRGSPDRMRLTWIDPDTGVPRPDGFVAGGARRSLRSPVSGDAVALLRAA